MPSRHGGDTALHIEVRPVEPGETLLLEHVFPYGPPEKHIDRWRRQREGEVSYLIAWVDGEPVGHGLLKWQGAAEKHIARHYQGQCPDVEDLFVLPDRRSMGIGSAILRQAETMVRERGFNSIGLSVDVHNTRAHTLYTCLGYENAGLGEHREEGEYQDAQGQLRYWDEVCIYLVKSLSAK